MCIAWQVIAFAMKEYGWSLDETLKYVRTKRAVVRPNKGFMRQLTTYEGILAARFYALPLFCTFMEIK